MLFHERPALTRMSMYHAARVIKMFNAAGHRAIGIVIGDGIKEPEQFDYARELGLLPYHAQNDPLYRKFRFAWQCAVQQQTDYVCKIDSNNLNSDAYWQRCIEKLGGKKVVTFGTSHFTVVSAYPEEERTCHFKTRQAIHLCNSGQFYLRYSIETCLDLGSLYDEGQTYNFDGYINKKLSGKWGDAVVVRLDTMEPMDCLDIKDGTDIHSYESYISRAPKTYSYGPNRSALKESWEELRLLDEGYFGPIPCKSAEQEA